MTGTNCDLFTHKQSRSYLNHLVHTALRQHHSTCRFNITYSQTMKVNMGGRSEMIWTQLICSNFIIFRLNTKKLLAQPIPTLGVHITAISFGASTWLHKTTLRVLQHHSQTDRHLHSFLAMAGALYPAEHHAMHKCVPSTNCRQPSKNI
jgi:hypothetical protein